MFIQALLVTVVTHTVCMSERIFPGQTESQKEIKQLCCGCGQLISRFWTVSTCWSFIIYTIYKIQLQSWFLVFIINYFSDRTVKREINTKGTMKCSISCCQSTRLDFSMCPRRTDDAGGGYKNCQSTFVSKKINGIINVVADLCIFFPSVRQHWMCSVFYKPDWLVP